MEMDEGCVLRLNFFSKLERLMGVLVFLNESYGRMWYRDFECLKNRRF